MLLRLLFALLILAGCASEADPEPDLGADPTVPAGPGEARAGVVRDGPGGEAALIGGVNAEGRPGDIALYNDRVRFIVGAVGRSHGFVDTGGNVIDADLVRGDGALGRDTVEDVFLSFGLGRLFDADALTLVSDGLDGGPAVVRASGRDVPWELFQGFFELPEPTVPDQHLRIVSEYALEPDSYSLRVTTTFTNEGDAVVIRPRDGVMASGEDLLPWTSGLGLVGPGGDPRAAVGVVGKQGEAAVVLWPERGDVTAGGLGELAADLGVVALGHGEFALDPGESVTLVRFWAVAPDPAAVEVERAAAQGRSVGTVVGSVREGAAGVPGVRVHFVSDGDPPVVAGFALTGADGAFEGALAPGEWTVYAVGHSSDEHVQMPPGAGRYGPFAARTVNARQLAALDGSAPAAPLHFAQGRPSPPPRPVTVQAGEEAVVDLEIAPASRLRIALADGGAPVPGVVDIQWIGPPTESPVPAPLRDALDVPSGSRAAWAWTSTGELDVPVLPGTYAVSAGHSWRHGRASTQVVVEPGGSPSIALDLPTVVARDGWLAMDPHLHGAPSFDGALAMEHRLVVCAATGVDVPVLTDHDRSADYQPVAAALGLDPRMAVVPGLEVTTLLRGHFNLFPTAPDPLGAPNGGVVRWWDIPRTTDELFEWMRAATPEDALLQVNHPRTPGMSSVARYDALAGEPRDPDFWSWDFELMELLNGGVDGLDSVRRDWFSFLNQGRRVVPTGVSDSHYTYIPCGGGRTDVYLGTDDVGSVTPEQVRDAVAAGRVVVAGGTTLRATLDAGDGLGLPGDTVIGSSATLSIEVRAPDWIVPGVLRLYRDGVAVQEQELAGPPVDGLWFRGEWPVEADADAWFAVEVEGDTPMGPAWRNATPYAMTNAFFLDVDGAGWVAPGL